MNMNGAAIARDGLTQVEAATRNSVQQLLSNKTSGKPDASLIRNQNYPFMFEVWENGIPNLLTRYILPINPEEYRISRPTRATVTYTLGGGYEDNNGLAFPKIMMKGTFGYLGTLVGGGGRHIRNAKNLDGWALFKELEENFLAFYDAYGTVPGSQPRKVARYNPASGSDAPLLKFYNYTDKDYFIVQVNKFDLLRSIQRRFLYQYDIQMTVLARADEPQEDASPDIIAETFLSPAAVRDPGVVANLIAAYAAAMGTMSNIQGISSDMVGVVNQINVAVVGFTQGVASTIKAPFSLVKAAIGSVDTLLFATRTITALPHEITNELRLIKQDLLRLSLHKDKFRADITATGTAAASTSTASEVLTKPIPNDQVGLTYELVPMHNPETTLFAVSNPPPDEATLRQVPIRDNDTIESIAIQLTGSRDNWQQIALANTLEYPFIGRQPMDRFTATAETGALANAVNVEDTAIYLAGVTTASIGKLLVFGEAAAVSVIESIDSAGYTKLAIPLTSGFVAGTTVTTHERQKAVLLPGDTIKVPGDDLNTIPLMGSDAEEFSSRLYGTDEYLAEDGSQQIDEKGDSKTITGLDNLRMQLNHRLNTPRGALAHLGHPTYGSLIPSFIGLAGEDMWYERIVMEARYTLLEDPRVKAVDNLIFQVQNTAIFFEADVTPINQIASQRINLLVS